MSFGLLSTGFVPKTSQILIEEVSNELGAIFGPTIATAALRTDTTLGHLVAILCDKYAELWELGEANYSSMDPNKATGDRLRAICAITGTIQLAAVSSTITQHVLTGTPTTVVSSGSRVANVLGVFEDPPVTGPVTGGDGVLANPDDLDAGPEYQTLADATISATTSWAPTTAYAVGDIVYNGSIPISGFEDGIFICTKAGTSAGSGGPMNVEDGLAIKRLGYGIDDGTVKWRWLGRGTGHAIAISASVDVGPVIGPAYHVQRPSTFVSGWNDASNLEDANLGNLLETEEDLRVRRELELFRPGEGTVNAIRTTLLGVTGVESVTVFVNDSDVTNGDGMPPHSVEAVIIGGDDQAIWDALITTVAAGIQTHGGEVGSAEDEQGVSHTEKFSRPDEFEINVIVNCDVDADLYPADGDTQVANAIVAFGAAQKTGKDVVASSLEAQCFTVDGMLDATCLIAVRPTTPTVTTTIPIDLRELAIFNVAWITVNATPVTP